MNNLVTVVFGAILTIPLFGECDALSSNLNGDPSSRWIRLIKYRLDDENSNSGDAAEEKGVRRVIRQTSYQNNVYPTLQPYPNSQVNQWQNPNSQYNPNNPYGNNASPYPGSQGYQPNNPYGTNNSPSGYPSSQGYKPSNYSSPYGTNSWQTNQHGQTPYQPYPGSYPQYNNTVTPYPGYRPGNTNYNPSYRPPYQQPNNYSGYPSHGYNTTPVPGYPGHQNPVIYANGTIAGQNSYPYGQNPYGQNSGYPGTSPYGSNSYNQNPGSHPGSPPYILPNGQIQPYPGINDPSRVPPHHYNSH